MTGKITDNLGRSSGLIKAVSAGRTGTVDWCTTAKTSPLTAVSGNGYFINTTGGAITVTLPSSPSAGDIVSLKDYLDTWGTACKAVTLGRGGSKIGGLCIDASLSTAGQSVTMVYVDGTRGWKNIQTDTTIKGKDYITASGGTETTCGDYKIHKFTSDGTFTVSAVAPATPANNAVAYMVVAGGGGSVQDRGGAGGAGGFREGTTSPVVPYSASPLVAGTGITVSATGYPITVGGGGAGDNSAPFTNGASGSNSVFSSITSAGGGGGGRSPTSGVDGGSGGGGGASAGSGNTPPVSPSQGNNGGTGSPASPPVGNGGGGGATAAGSNAPGPSAGGAGGAGATTSISGTPTAYAGGGGGGLDSGAGASGGAGGGGDGGGGPYPGSSVAAEDGTVNTGGGAGGTNGGGPSVTARAGGSGVVIIRYRYQ